MALPAPILLISRVVLPLVPARIRRALCTQSKLGELFSSKQNPLQSSSAQLAASQPCEDAHRAVILKDGSSLFGMLDGHAGTHAVNFGENTLISQAVTRLESLSLAEIHPDLDEPRDTESLIADALIQSFERTDELYMEELRRIGSPGKAVKTGACAMLVLVDNQSKVHVANAGDCRCVLIRESEQGRLEAVALSNDHNALTNSAETDRLEMSHPGEKRLIVRGYVKGRVQITRSIGDLYLKYAEFNTDALGKTKISEPYNPPYLTCTPEVTTHNICPSDRYLVIATDGLWSELSNQEVLKIAEGAIDNESCPAKELAACALKEAAEMEGLPVEAMLRISTGPIRKRIHDDITVTVVKLNEHAAAQDQPSEKGGQHRILQFSRRDAEQVVLSDKDGQDVCVPQGWLPEGMKSGDKVKIVAIKKAKS